MHCKAPRSTSGTVWTCKRTQAPCITTKEFLPKLTHDMSITCEGQLSLQSCVAKEIGTALTSMGLASAGKQTRHPCRNPKMAGSWSKGMYIYIYIYICVYFYGHVQIPPFRIAHHGGWVREAGFGGLTPPIRPISGRPWASLPPHDSDH